MTDLIPKYKFVFDPEMIEKVKKFVYKKINFNTDPIKFEVKEDKTTISFVTNEEEKLFKLHHFLLKIHEITGNRKKEKIKKPIISITLKNGGVHKDAYFNYILGKDFCRILKDNSIKFSVSEIKKNGFHYLDTCPIWINEDDFINVKKILKESIYGKTFRVAVINFNVLKEKKKKK